MMYKIFLVEDEFIIREGIKNKIDWAGNGYEFCGEASDGELAFPMIQKLHPDIVITDIKMPFMDGLELSTLIKNEMPDIEIIILSGFTEFEYAKKAISLGVAEFLSKPINSEDLLNEVNKVADRLDEKRKEQELKQKYKKEMEENYQVSWRQLLQDLVTGGVATTSLLEQAKELGINLSALCYNMILFKMWSGEKSEQEYSNTKESLNQKIQKYCKDNDFILFDRGLEGYAIILKADEETEMDGVQNKLVADITDMLNMHPHMRYFGGIGTKVNRLSELPVSFDNASHAFARRYMTEENLFAEYDNHFVQKADEEEFDITKINTKQVDRSEILKYLKLAEPSEAVYFVEEYINEFDKSAIGSTLFRQYIAMDVYFCSIDFIQGLGLDKSEIPTLDVTGKDLQSVDGTKKYLSEVLAKAATLREQSVSDKYSDVVDEVLNYVENHYSDEELSLNEVASVVNLSPNHLSTIFSQKTGQTFIKYLTDYRMNKAKELLKCTNKKSSAISFEVGYKDSHYFSFLFKKTQGMTPTQFRGEKVIDEGEDN